MAIDINRTNNDTGGGDPSNWMYFCEQGVCYKHQNGNLTYAQCKMNCAPHPCSMFGEACADANAVWNGTSPYNMQQLVQHWVNMFALPQMGGHSFTHTELGNYLLKCCYVPPTPRPPHSPRARILNRPVRGRGRKIGYSNFTSSVFKQPIVPALVMGMVIGVGLFASYQLAKSLKV